MKYITSRGTCEEIVINTMAYIKSEIGTTGVRENVGYMRCPPSKNLAYLNEVL